MTTSSLLREATGADPSAVENAAVEATVDMCVNAFDTIVAALSPSMPRSRAQEPPTSRGGVFVTWNVSRSRDARYSLRGCIGTLSPAPLHIAIPRYATQAAFHDSRFDPISAAELPKLKVAVSVLSRFEEAEHVYDWSIGVHGIILTLEGGYSATYLPEVCSDNGWSKQFCVRSLTEKAGYRRPLDESVLKSASVTRYQSTKSEITFEDYAKIVQSARQ